MLTEKKHSFIMSALCKFLTAFMDLRQWVKADVNEVPGGMTKFSNLWMLSVIGHSSLLSGSFTASG
jgi:hypothetical protein